MERWFETWPDLFEDERLELEALGLLLDQSEIDRGRVVFTGMTESEGDEIELIVVFPASFPALRPEVFAPKLDLGRHQNPFRKNLCLLDRSTRAWDPGLTAGELLRTQLPKLLKAIKQGGKALRDAEVPQGEPLSRFYRGHAGMVIFVPDEMLRIDRRHRSGELRFGTGLDETIDAQLRACLAEVREPRTPMAEGAVLAEVQAPLAERFGKTGLKGTWVRLDEFPDSGAGDATALLAAAKQAEGYKEPPWFSLKGASLRVVGLVAPEEVRQGEFEDTWIFAAEHRQAKKITSFIVKGDRLGLSDLTARVPSLDGMQDRAIALAGLGALGGPLAFELAKALTGDLRILDNDDAEAGNIVRWPLGISTSHFSKADVLASLPRDWPYTRVRAFKHYLGMASLPTETEDRDEVEVVTEFLDSADLLVDATAETGVQQFLGAEAMRLGLPHVFVWMTEGGVGGVVARVIPGETGCWYCLQWHFEKQTIPLPPHEKTGTVQPRGCANPTYTGTSFDALALVTQAMRVITDTTLHGRVGDAPDDVFVCDQSRRPDGSTSAPMWQAYPLMKREECPYCAAGEAE